jgi:hypothetical protein
LCGFGVLIDGCSREGETEVEESGGGDGERMRFGGER